MPKRCETGQAARFMEGMDKARWDSETPLFAEDCAAGGATLVVGLGVVIALLVVVFLVL